MSPDIPESDWRRFKEAHQRLLERYYHRILDDLSAVIQSTEGTAHDRYVKAYKLIQARDEQIANAFNDFRRSTAVMQLGIMRQMGLLTDEDLAVFSDGTQERVRIIGSL